MPEFVTKLPKFITENGDQLIYPFGPCIFQTWVDSNFTKELLEEGRKLTKEEDDFNQHLAGNLKYGRSYHYKDEYMKKVESYLKIYVERFFNGLYSQYGPKYEGVKRLLKIQTGVREQRQGDLMLESLWINFSQKHDFNPPHTHSGILSFVLFCQVPQKIFSVQADCNTQRAGELHFQYGEPISKLDGTEFPIKPAEDLLLIFPAELRHFVPAYWVDAERVSVSGNFILI